MEDECYTLVVKASMGCAFVIERAGRGGKLFGYKKNLPGLYAGRFFTDQK
jgi:hypothetical protein